MIPSRIKPSHDEGGAGAARTGAPQPSAADSTSDAIGWRPGSSLT